MIFPIPLNKEFSLAITSFYKRASSLYNQVSSIVGSNTIPNTIAILGLNEVNSLATLAGRKISAWTRGYIQLNTFVPKSARFAFRTLGVNYTAPCISKMGKVIGRLFGINKVTAASVIAAPIVEELCFRFPLLIASWGIDAYSEGILGESLFSAVHFTGADALKGIAAIFLSIGFTYIHFSHPNPGRAAGIFASGMVLSGMTLKSGLSGLGAAMLSHGVHNLRARLGLSAVKAIDAS